jgi:uncharacterized protein YcaQ
MRSFTWEMACRRRLARHSLLEPLAQDRLVDAVRTISGVQAQILSAAELAIGARVAGVTRRDVQAALWERHALVKTYGPRGTLHLLPADELSLWMAALRAYAMLHEPYWYATAGLSLSQADALLEAIGEALDGCCLTRQELASAVAQRVGEWAQERLLSAWGELLAPAAFVGRLCFGPSRGNQVTFVRADQWVDGWQELDPQQALAEVCRRYFAAYGPASHQDFAHWFRLKPDEARRVMESLAGELEEVNLAGRHTWMLVTDAEEEWEPQRGSLRLLPSYDCYVLGCGPREWVVPKAARTRVSTYGRGRFEGATALPVLLIDGVVAGMWEQRKLASRSELRVEAFGQLTPHQQEQLEAEAAHIGAFLKVEVALSLGALG